MRSHEVHILYSFRQTNYITDRVRSPISNHENNIAKHLLEKNRYLVRLYDEYYTMHITTHP